MYDISNGLNHKEYLYHLKDLKEKLFTETFIENQDSMDWLKNK